MSDPGLRLRRVPFLLDFEPIEVLLPRAVVSLRVAEDSDVERWRRTWEALLVRTNADDAPWDWSGQIRRADRVEGFLCLAALSGERLEGLLSLSLRQSQIDPKSVLVYVEYLATAPWNRREIVDSPEVRGLGRVLMQSAIRISLVLGHAGRIGLHSKPAAERFYRDKLRLLDLGREIAEDGEWVYFEATSEVARRVL